MTRTQLKPPQIGNEWWEELGRTVWTTGATITVANFAAKQFLRIIVINTDTSVAGTVVLTFNNDSGANYANRRSLNGAADNTGVSLTSTEIMPNYKGISIATVDIVNINGAEKVGAAHGTFADGTGATAIPNKAEYAIKWTGTSQIITLAASRSVNFASGSIVIVLGHD